LKTPEEENKDGDGLPVLYRLGYSQEGRQSVSDYDWARW
jgi:hypothetical protein